MKIWRSLPLLLIIALLTACTPAPANVAPPAVPTIALPPSPAPTDVAPTSAPPTDTPAPTPTPRSLDKLVSAAQEEGQLNVVALPHDWMNFGQIITGFSQKYGIKVKEMEPGAGSKRELALLQIGKTDPAHTPDVVDLGLSFALQAQSQHLLAPYRVSTWDSIPAKAKDEHGYWYGDYYGLIVFEINPALVQTIPQDWPDLLHADYKIAMGGYPNQSYVGMVTVYSASVAAGGSLDDTMPGLRYFQQINHNGSLSANFMHATDTVASGQVPLALTWDYLALADKRVHPELVIVVPKTGLVAGLYAQGISAYAAHPNAARLWMEYLYSDEGQLLLLQGLGHPVRFGDLNERGVIPASLLAELLPPAPYLEALLPSAEQMSAADRSIIASWRNYVK